MPLAFKLCHGQAETHGKDTQSWEGRRAALSLLCFRRVRRCVCTWLPFGVPVCLVLCHLHASLSHSPRPSPCLCVWVSKPLCVSLCLSLFGLWVSLSSTRSQTVCLPPIRCVPRSEFPFGVWKCEYHQINELGAQCLCPLVPSAASPAAGGRCLEEGESAELQKRMGGMELEMLQEDVEGDSGLQVATSRCNSLSLTSPPQRSPSTQLWVGVWPCLSCRF